MHALGLVTVLLTLLHVCMSTSSSSSPLIITSLPDGVSIRGAEDLRQVVATWDVFVTFDPPPFPEMFAKQVDELGYTFGALQGLAEQGVSFDLKTHEQRRK